MRFFIKALILVAINVMPLFGQDNFSFKPSANISVEHSGSSLSLAWAGGLNSAQFGTIDLNNDGTEDLYVFDRTTNKSSTFINTGSSYQYAPQYEYLFPENLNGWVLLADYDCDGKKDIFTNTTFGLKVYRNVTVDQLEFELVADPLLTESNGQMVNLQVGSSDIPAITDIDGDGDLDILTFQFAIGNSVEYHQNQSMETVGNCSQLAFVLDTPRWGDFEECECGEYAFVGTCSNPGGRTKHAGGKALLAFDQDFDGALELVFGDEFCTNIAFLTNYGTAENAVFNDAYLDYPNAQNPVDFFIYPGLFLEDVNFDGRKDLLASPAVFDNFGLGVDFKNSSHLYLNDGVTGFEAFNTLQSEAFLQEDMIELGESVVPTFMDVDGDGDEDMILGHRGIRSGSGFFAQFELYENIGDISQPHFELADEDYLGLSGSRLNTLKPSVGDLDGDGNIDLVFSAADVTGQTGIYYFLDGTGPGFDPVDANPESVTFIIQAGDHPYFEDIDNDGLADLLLGKRTGRLEYWRNSGNFTFELIDETLAGIIDDSFRRELAPMAADINNDGSLELVTTDATGVMRVYTNFLGQAEEEVQVYDLLINPDDEATQSVRSRLGRGTAVASANLGSQLPHLVIGSKLGGVFLFENESEPGNGPGEGDQFTMDVFPNPALDHVTIRSRQQFKIEIHNTLGQLIMDGTSLPDQTLIRFDSRLLYPGIYLITGISSSGARDTRKLIVAR